MTKRFMRIKTWSLTLLFCVAMQVLQAQTVDQVIDKYIGALGGKAKMMALRSLTITGVIQVQGLDMVMTSSVINKMGVRSEVEIPGAGTMYQIITPNKGWSFMPTGANPKPAPLPLTAEQISAGQPNLDLQGALLNYKQKGHKAELLGTEMADSISCYKIKLTYKTGQIAYYFIDVQNYYRVKLISTEVVNGVPIEKATSYSDFRRTPEGYLLPYVQVNRNGIMKVTKIAINPPIKPSIFIVK